METWLCAKTIFLFMLSGSVAADVIPAAKRLQGLPEVLNARNLRPSLSIINGTAADEGEIPSALSFQILVDGQWLHQCGAVLINKQYAVTAAHCVDGLPQDTRILRKEARLVGGTTDLTNPETGQIRRVYKYNMHHWYLDVFPYIADIALLTVLRKGGIFFNMSDPNVRSAPLPKRLEDFTGSKCVVTGWGFFNDANIGSPILLKGEVNVVSRLECIAAWTSIWASHICALDPRLTQRSCQGDSGGALMCQRKNSDARYLAGIVSWGQDRCQLGFPTVFTRISVNFIYDFVTRNKRRRCNNGLA